MSEFQAAMGICNLRHVDAEIAKRKAVYERYLERLGNVPGLKLWRPQPNIIPNYAYLPTIFEESTENLRFCSEALQNGPTHPEDMEGRKAVSAASSLRDRVWEALKAEGITARKYFWPLTSDLQCYGYLKECAEEGTAADTPIARRIASQVLTLPIYADLSMEDVDRICRIILETLKRPE